MIIKPIWIAFAAIALVSGGCVTDGTLPLLQSSGQDFSNGATAASNVLSTEINAAPQVDRRFFTVGDVGKQFPTDDTWDAGFEKFACAGLDDGAHASAGLTTATQAANYIGALSAKSSDTLSDVQASIQKYRKSGAPTLDMPKSPLTDRGAVCTQTVKGRLAALRSAAKSQAGAGPFPDFTDAISAIEALYNSAVTLYTALAKAEDASLREQLLKKFLNDPATDKALVAALGSCAHYDPTNSVDSKDAIVVPDKCDEGLLTKAEVQDLFDRRVASTLVVPFVQYYDTQKQWLPQGPNGDPVAPAAGTLSIHEYVERMETVRANLADFDAIRTQTAPGDLGMPIIKAYLNLRRINDGKLTQDEKNKAFSAELDAFASLMSELYKDVTDLQSKASAASTAVQKL